LFFSALWGIINPLLLYFGWHYVLIGVVKTLVTGLISMIVFYPIFSYLFKNYQATSQKKKKKLDKLVQRNAKNEKIEQLRLSYEKDLLLAKQQELTQSVEMCSSLLSNYALIYLRTKLLLKVTDSNAVDQITQLEKLMIDLQTKMIDVKRNLIASKSSLETSSETAGKVL
jgi:hypothetical protein